MGYWPKENKYHAKQVYHCLACDEPVYLPKEKPPRCVKCKQPVHRFASKDEYKRYAELRVMERFGDIINLEVEPRYPIVVEGEKIGTYVGDFRYTTKQGAVVVEDVKSPVTKTNLFVWKKKLVKALYHIDVREIYSGR